MRTATCRSCQRLFTTGREDDEHCERCQPWLPGLAPEQRPLFPEAALGGPVGNRRRSGAGDGPGRGRGHFPKG